MSVERTPLETKIELTNLHVWFGDVHALRGITFAVASKTTIALIGKGAAGKSTLLRSLNRLLDLEPTARTQGSIKIDGAEMLAAGVDTGRLRRNVGMVFQRPTMLPTSVADNVAFGLVSQGIRDRRAIAEASERALRRVALWERLSGVLDAPAASLSDDLAQRLSIARALAVEPDVLLFDDPTALLDPVAALAVEDVIAHLRRDHTILIATNELSQAARLSDVTIYMADGEIIELGDTPLIFSKPADARTEAFIAGRYS